MKKLRKFVFWSATVGVCTTLFLLITAPFYVYRVFDADDPIARLTFEQVGERRYIAQLRRHDFCQPRSYLLQGDQWQLDASFVKWKGLGVMLGLQSRYRLDRLTGRYGRVEEQNREAHLAHQLSPRLLFDVFQEDGADDVLLPGFWAFLRDTQFGSSVYMPIDTEHVFTVYRTEDALIARSAPRSRVTWEDGMAVIPVDYGCGRSPSAIERFARAINHLLLASD